ncbi:condensation domain-containing protein [Paenibacillus sp. N1-5-1-14]|uniref:condensation domain-containing protein n=1 Tax=Paenibacillus radicibacter TaxID=2972488 RepID=UPI002158FC4E|nr:condensation domain-containing protein [Paenibacillus radicibacter]MCR8644638.1 condensation domain-containing protein [Paenibacillus radicibacter]
MGKMVNQMELREMAPLHEKIVYAEKHKKNYDIYFSVQYDSKLSVDELDAAIQYVMSETEVFHYRVIQQGSQYGFGYDRGGASLFRRDHSLEKHKINVLQGDPLANYYINAAAGRIEFLMHHLIFDGDSLYLFLDNIEQAIRQRQELSLPTVPYSIKFGSDRKDERGSSYQEQIKKCTNRSRERAALDTPIYAKGELSPQVHRAVISLAQKLRVTKFAVLLLVTALLARHQEQVIGVVVSRKDKRDQANVIGNFTDIAPLLLRLDTSKNYMDNAKMVFKNLFTAIDQSASLSYDEYRGMVGPRGFDYIVSYTRMQHLEEQSTIFSKLELGPYLVKYDNHVQFNEYHDHLAWEICYNDPLMHIIQSNLEDLILGLDQMELTTIVTIDACPATEKVQVEQSSDVPPIQEDEGFSMDQLFSRYEEHVNLFDSGISSFEIANLITDVHEKLGVTLSYSDMYSTSTIAELKGLITSRFDPVQVKEQVSNKPYYVCPSFVKAIFIDSFRFVDSDLYDVVYAYRLRKSAHCELEKLKFAIEQVIRSNDVFATSFAYEDGEVIGVVQSDRLVELDLIEVTELADMNHLPRCLQILGKQKLWDLKLIHIQSTDEMYFYVHMHHIIVDHMALGIFLQQIEMNYHGIMPSYTQYSQISNLYEKTINQALQGWSNYLDHDNYPNIGKPSLASGHYTDYEWIIPKVNDSYSIMEKNVVGAITRTLAPIFGESKGYIGAVYHGRVVPNSNQVIQSFARVLPIFFDITDEEVVQSSLRNAHEYQAVSIYDLQSAGVAIEYPHIVIQTLPPQAAPSVLFDHTIEFEGQNKFQLFINLIPTDQAWKLHVYMDSGIYDASERDAIVTAIESGLLQLDTIEGDKADD